MIAPTIAEMLKYANLYMAAEVLYNFSAKDNSALAPGDINSSDGHFTGPIDPTILTDVNRFGSRFAPTEAEKIGKEWTVVDHLSNTETGFSGTLFQNKDTKGYVLSMRRTEFIDDVMRDGVATNVQEIKAFGWAFGQISDMEARYAKLKESGKLPSGAKLDVTGYSLDGHLTTAFNLMHNSELNGGQVVNFNAAGVGQLKNGATLDNVIKDFNELRSDTTKIAAQFTNSDLRAVLLTLSSRIKNGEPVMPSDYVLLNSVKSDPLGDEFQQQQFVDEKFRLRKALERVETLQTMVARIELGQINNST